ncbi:CidA/LrgA family protein [Vibrio cidicii]|uniref:CidA/LrgA family protein n=1 Tax=Vibrio cidicii TaxID=1763883 RepID=UPI003704AB3F
MKFSLKTLLGLMLSFGLIFLSLNIGMAISHWLETSIPASVIGMLVLFLAMASGLVKVEWVKPGASLLIRYMILLFVPISVGLMEHFDLLLANALPILASAIGGTLIVLVSLSWLLDRILHKES